MGSFFSAGPLNLDRYHATEQLVSFPPKAQATPCKPVLFDLAFNDIEYNDITQRFPVLITLRCAHFVFTSTFQDTFINIY